MQTRQHWSFQQKILMLTPQRQAVRGSMSFWTQTKILLLIWFKLFSQFCTNFWSIVHVRCLTYCLVFVTNGVMIWGRWLSQILVNCSSH